MVGSTLLNILPGMPFGVNHTKVFKKMNSIIRIRNRIAHHEPICFAPPTAISTAYATSKYYQVRELLQGLGINANSFLFGVDGLQRERQYIDNL
jgi:hypothetical protein